MHALSVPLRRLLLRKIPTNIWRNAVCPRWRENFHLRRREYFGHWNKKFTSTYDAPHCTYIIDSFYLPINTVRSPGNEFFFPTELMPSSAVSPKNIHSGHREPLDVIIIELVTRFRTFQLFTGNGTMISSLGYSRVIFILFLKHFTFVCFIINHLVCS